MDLAFSALIVGAFVMAFVGVLAWSVTRKSAGTPHMREIASYIQEGARAFLRREIKTISYFIVALTALLWISLRWEIALGFVFGSFLSLLAAYIGMSIAVRANVRTTQAARKSVSKAFVIAFRGGAVTGLSVVGMSLLGLGVLYFAYGKQPSLLVGFGFGASLVTLFAQLGGGIYTKAADVGADLVGKVEARIPEDDPRNPAVIADQVGDNVGDCAARGADLFGSFSHSILGAMIIGLAFVGFYGYNAIIFPLLIGSIGASATIVGVLFIRESGRDLVLSLYVSYFVTGSICMAGFYGIAVWIMQDLALFYCATLGLLASLVVAIVVQYYTGLGRKPTRKIAEAAQSGAAINIMTGFSYGLESASLPLLLVAAVTIISYVICGGGLRGIYGIVTATMGILSTTGIIMASDTFGPIVDNASGIAEMSGLGGEVREVTDALDATGNVTKALTKGFAMAYCVLTAIVILFAYLSEVSRYQGIQLTSITDIVVNLVHPVIVASVFVGAAIPFLFSALAIRAVGKTAFQMVEEVRRQFREIPGLLEGRGKPDYSRCVDISTRNALREMIAPTLVALVAPIAVGFLLGVWALAAYVVTINAVAGILAVLMFNAGGAWDNAKKYIEAGYLGGKGTPTHAAAVIGDTFGDPLKDTAGPSLHVLIKLQEIIALTILPLFLTYAIIW